MLFQKVEVLSELPSPGTLQNTLRIGSGILFQYPEELMSDFFQPHLTKYPKLNKRGVSYYMVQFRIYTQLLM